jgi:hypothetical protein
LIQCCESERYSDTHTTQLHPVTRHPAAARTPRRAATPRASSDAPRPRHTHRYRTSELRQWHALAAEPCSASAVHIVESPLPATQGHTESLIHARRYAAVDGRAGRPFTRRGSLARSCAHAARPGWRLRCADCEHVSRDALRLSGRRAQRVGWAGRWRERHMRHNPPLNDQLARAKHGIAPREGVPNKSMALRGARSPAAGTGACDQHRRKLCASIRSLRDLVLQPIDLSLRDGRLPAGRQDGAERHSETGLRACQPGLAATPLS